MPTDTKRWYESRTVWFNVVTFVLGGIAALNADTMPSWFLDLTVAANFVGNIVLRKLTDTKLQ